MNITCVGCGYVGLVVGTCLAEQGHRVLCVDSDVKKINGLKRGVLPIYEPGLGEILDRNVKEGRQSFGTSLAKGIKTGEVIFIAVGTPMEDGGKADVSAVLAVAREIGQSASGGREYKIVVIKSTVPVGTASRVARVIKSNQRRPRDFDVVSNPEFLREGTAVKDFLEPDRVIVGLDNPSPRLRKTMETLYRGITDTEHPLLFTNTRSAELIKYASNAMLATRVSFMNEIAGLCENVGADVTEVARGVGLDSRIGPRFLEAGVGYGGSCLPKDVKALAKIMRGHGLSPRIIETVDKINEEQKLLPVKKIKTLLPTLKGKKIAIWGLAFKPGTDDMREAPSLAVIKELQKAGARIQAFDPVAEARAKTLLKHVNFCNDPYRTLRGCDALIILTEWNEFRGLDKKRMKALLKTPNVVDGRNVYDPGEMRRLGFNYLGIGRS
ncbi:MAG TPA: UDP-glucose dehydrogenase family protein [Candidatus Tripitaka californicus]|uniref:UDP-glucose dehydrogenase family protein n=1 Tax=Candidatus Tripitaka californicus TaxID=3367616 RepID=UPI004029AC5F|nr:UDP-glucose/GDP-mannose dehydrogenase family protein [Planctomycetota bacterium]